MSSIRFVLSDSESWDKLFQLWFYFHNKDHNRKIDKAAVKEILGNQLETKFWSEEEAKEIGNKWFELPYQERLSHPEFFEKWHFESWIDALENTEISLDNLEKNGDEGKLVFQELSFPSGGIKALEFLVQIFDGQILNIEK